MGQEIPQVARAYMGRQIARRVGTIMIERETVLFVGGEIDGQRREIHHQPRYYEVPLPLPPATFYPKYGTEENEIAPWVNRQRYVRQPYAGRVFYLAEDEKRGYEHAVETLVRLLYSGYRAPL